MLLDMINRQPTGVNFCSYTHWMTGSNWLQPVWCNKAHYYANPASLSDSSVAWAREREKEKRQSREGEGAEEWLRVSVIGVWVCARPRLAHWEAGNTKAAASLVSSALTTLLVIRMTFENILTEDKRLNIEWVDLSTAKLQLEGWESTLKTMRIEALRICNLPISCLSVLALAFQGESWNNQDTLIQSQKKGWKACRCGVASQWLVFTHAALLQITTCPLHRGLLARAILVELALRPHDGI